jgi:hypothetical protein
VENEGSQHPVDEPSRVMISMSNEFNEDHKEMLKEDVKRNSLRKLGRASRKV